MLRRAALDRLEVLSGTELRSQSQTYCTMNDGCGDRGVRGAASFATGQHVITYRFPTPEVMVSGANPSLHFFVAKWNRGLLTGANRDRSGDNICTRNWQRRPVWTCLYVGVAVQQRRNHKYVGGIHT